MASFEKRSSYKLTNHQQVSLVVLPVVFNALALLFTCLRIYARRLKRAKVLADDYLCIAACILSLAMLGGNIAMVVAAGGGNSIMSMKDPNDLYLWLKLLIATYLIWCVAVAVIQLAILFLYNRLFFIVDWFRKTVYVLMGLVFIWFVAAWASDLAICKPVKKLWDPLAPGSCADGKKMCNAVGLVHAIIDFFILTLPLPLIWKLKTSTSNKVVLSVLLLCGVFATMCAILRLECLINLTHWDSMDLPAYTWLSLIYHFIEVPVAIICCCVPALPPLKEKVKLSSFGSYARSMFGRSTSGSRGSSNKEVSTIGGGKPSKGSENSSRNFTKLGSAQGSETRVSKRPNSDEIPLGDYQIGVERTYVVNSHDGRA